MPLGLFWKRPGPSSQQFLNEIKREMNWAKPQGKRRSALGHSGTLDPFAEGLLLVAQGEATKLLAPLGSLSKSYRAQMLFGLSSDTLDITGHCVSQSLSRLSELKLWASDSSEASKFFQDFLDSQLGRFEQYPPSFSAIHIDGKRAYEWARQGIHKELKARLAELYLAKHLSFTEAPESLKRQFQASELYIWEFDVEVSSGTYIRSFAESWAKLLVGTPGLLLTLKRHGIGPFKLAGPAEAPYMLKAKDLAPLFDFRNFGPEAALRLSKNGLMAPDSYARNTLIFNHEEQAIAWVPPGAQAEVGRVFLQDPFI